jgi:hypothetical protein
MDPKQAAATYYASWGAKDFDTLRSVLADDCTFEGPLGTAANGDECRKGVEGMSKIVKDVVVRKAFVDGPDVVTWFDLHTDIAPPCPTASWIHVEDGRIKTIQATFDPRELVK